MDEFDAMIFDEIKKLSLDPEYFEEVKTSERNDDEQIEIISEEISKLDDQIRKLLELYSVNGIPLDALQEKINNLDNQRKRLENHLEDLRQEQSPKMSREEAAEIINIFEDVLKRNDIDEVRAVISSLIDKIVVQEEKLQIFWKF